MFVSSLAKNFEQSNQLLMPVLLPCMFFSGFFIPENLVPQGWKWVPDVNFLYYSTNYAVVREVQIMEGGCGAFPFFSFFPDFLSSMYRHFLYGDCLLSQFSLQFQFISLLLCWLKTQVPEIPM